jgi:ribosomal protein L32
MRADGCIHYTGALNPATGGVCGEGINYRELVGGPVLGWISRLPCSAGEARGGDKVSCPKYRAPTAEEIAEDKRRTDESIRRFMAVQSGKVREWREAQRWSKKNRVSATGVVPCEACGKGEIRLSMAAYNGHVHGKCTTDGCVSWME